MLRKVCYCQEYEFLIICSSSLNVSLASYSWQELCNKAVSSELTREQEALLGFLLPVFESEPHKIVDPVTMLFRKAKELAGDEVCIHSQRYRFLEVSVLIFPESLHKIWQARTI